jgi:hypothetical protein
MIEKLRICIDFRENRPVSRNAHSTTNYTFRQHHTIGRPKPNPTPVFALALFTKTIIAYSCSTPPNVCPLLPEDPVGVILGDLTREDRDVYCNWWNWIPTVRVLSQSGVIDADRIERMTFSGGGATVTADEARRIADYISTEWLPCMRDQDEVKFDGTISDEPRWFGSISEVPSDEMLYGASRMWLETFVGFCRECGGFSVG